MTEEERWIQAIMDRDRAYDGRLYYGVITTGIYCRPSCPSRRPQRRNLRLFPAVAAAVAAGFRPCKRCRPEQAGMDTAGGNYVAEACRLMAEQDLGAMTVEQLARAVGLSARRLRDLFSRHLGVSPRQFHNSQRINRLREALSRGEDVTHAIYAAGFHSPSRAYTDIGRKLGMTPSTYRQGGRDQAIEFLLLPSSLGHVLVAGTERGLCSLQLGDDPDALRARLRAEFPRASLSEGRQRTGDWGRALVAYLDGEGAWPLLPMDVRATAFQARVWQLLRNIPEGQTLSYKAVAQQLGNPDGARAVARACAANPLALVIPCHRVVRQDGKDTRFRWGPERKRALLEHEHRRAGRGRGKS